MRRFGSFQLEPQLFSHFESIPRTAGAESEPVFFLAVVENVVNQFVQAPSLRAARRGCPREHLQRQSHFFRQQHPFIDCQLGHGLHHLIDPFAYLSIAVLSQIGDHTPDVLKNR